VTRRQAADLALVGNTIVWGATFVLVKAAIVDIPPMLFLALRFTLATAALAIAFGTRLRKDGAVMPGVFIGLFLFGGYFFQTVGLRFTSAPKSAFLTGLTSVMVPLMASVVYRIRPQRSEIIGVLVATFGLALMTLEHDIWSVNRGDLLTFVCTLAFAAHIVTVGHFSERIRFELLSIVQIGTAAVLAWTLFWTLERPVQVHWRPTVVYGILITGLLATAWAFSAQAWAQHYTTSTRTALIYMLEPVVAAITSFLLAGEGLSARAAAGAALILAGVLLVELKPLNPRLHP
jgi:drug/metabolite transporter (DMT)-like permease